MNDDVVGKPIEILLVEDNPGDIRLTQEAFKEAKVRNRLSVVTDGEMAMEFLHKTGKFMDAPRPDIILLDLNLPKRDGREVLSLIKQDPDLRCIPVIVLTTSKAEMDILKAYNLNANCYIEKPMEFYSFTKTLQSIGNFWLIFAKLPEAQE
jgi:two-component system, chemotaxis family, response regulator Rcp1